MNTRSFAKGFIIMTLFSLMLSGTMLSAQAESGRLSGGDAATREASRSARGPRSTDGTEVQRKARLEMRARLAVSNRLALNIGTLKYEAAERLKLAKNRIQRLMKNNDGLTGDQLAALKDVVVQLKNQRENITAQEKVLREVRKRFEALRQEGQFSEAVPVADELISSQKTMLELLRASESGISTIIRIQENQN